MSDSLDFPSVGLHFHSPAKNVRGKKNPTHTTETYANNAVQWRSGADFMQQFSVPPSPNRLMVPFWCSIIKAFWRSAAARTLAKVGALWPNEFPIRTFPFFSPFPFDAAASDRAALRTFVMIATIGRVLLLLLLCLGIKLLARGVARDEMITSVCVFALADTDGTLVVLAAARMHLFSVWPCVNKAGNGKLQTICLFLFLEKRNVFFEKLFFCEILDI